MALIKETDEWVENIYLIEPNDPVEGGEDGVDNRPHIELANRTAFLNKKRQEQEQKTQEIDEKVNGLTTKVDEIQITIQNGGNNQSLGDLDTKLTQEIQARTEGDSHLQGQIDALKKQIAQILANKDPDTNATVAYLKFTVIGGYHSAVVTEVDKTGDISVGTFDGGYPKSVTVRLPAEFNADTHRYRIDAQPLPYNPTHLTEGRVLGTSHFNVVNDDGGQIVISIPSGSYIRNNQNMDSVDYVSMAFTIEVLKK